MNTYSHYGDIDTAARRPSVSDEERAELRASVRDFFVKHTSPSQIVHWLETDPGYDPAVLTAIYTQLALPSIRIPERFGGMGYGWQELGVVLEETGRALTGVPFLSGQIAAAALLELGDEEGRSRVLSGLASGANRCTVAGLSERGPLSFGVRAEPADSPEVSWSLDGTARFVIDGAGADTILVLAETRSGPALFMPASPAPGMLRRPLVTMDMTRPMADIEFNAVPAVPLGEVSPGMEGAERLSLWAALLLSAEQLGGARSALGTTVDHLRQRVQFGRPLGSFQALKHRCADLLVAVRGAEAVLTEALTAAEAGSTELPVLAHLAAAVCSDTYVEVARAMIQMHGGIGFTWEHIAHVHLKRAKTSQLMFGTPAEHRGRLAEILGLPAPSTRPWREIGRAEARACRD
ncbi:acyl-CoA dehydrogenase family protein [Actinomadura madurae]|uniref:acyl-CoA dehydrogenase family protein n=1 Tax=Actinomadura madurae TaxID=1993 RepID=UPI0020D25DCC|nr:acyl-CoA dehydrogenase family protein [Actinomadura madurae]MCP9955667.1 acyl-CoA/acyl-ACP dehydrogenase [Actinomadura madurae]MCP9972400.1 acyl-CoA/acyl-ACP dehydrogenase [Actinomadura madurae]MCP9984913.1 acyl-CoA/acyl-ACP dehydrogenase [Actinomadura madurae]MCQ0021104.1 acyl-CoA/acyl-ACP dehydrogenase [Actinomadura madurae]